MLTSDKKNLVNKLWHHLSWGSIGQLVLITLLRPQQLIHNSDILQPVIRTNISHIISAWLVQITTQHELMLVKQYHKHHLFGNGWYHLFIVIRKFPKTGVPPNPMKIDGISITKTIQLWGYPPLTGPSRATEDPKSRVPGPLKPMGTRARAHFMLHSAGCCAASGDWSWASRKNCNFMGKEGIRPRKSWGFKSQNHGVYRMISYDFGFVYFFGIHPTSCHCDRENDHQPMDVGVLMQYMRRTLS